MNRFNTVYNGFWFPGEATWTGGGFFLNKNYRKQCNVRLFGNYGLCRWVNINNEYNKAKLVELSKKFNIYTEVYDTSANLISKKFWHWDVFWNLTHKDTDTNTTMVSCYSKIDDSYVGTPQDALALSRHLIDIQGDGSSKCSCIGFDKKAQKWYGFSHRAKYGFGVGSKVSKGDLAYVPDSVDDLYEELLSYYDKDTLTKTKTGVIITSQYVAYNTEPPLEGCEDCADAIESSEYEICTGRGEWVAYTLDDSKQMAIDFAHGVS